MLVKNKKEDLLNYLEDTSNLPGKADSLYVLQERKEILTTLNQAVNKKTPITFSAGRTGTTGGCVPCEGALISSDGLNRILDIDDKQRLVSLESGVSLEVLEKEANKFGLTLRASPTESLAYVGGVISTAASGVRGFGYGGIRNYIVELEVFLTGGERIKIQRGKVFAKTRHFNFESGGKKFEFDLPNYNLPAVKSQAGYFVKDNMDLIDLFIGSEGTLGFIASAQILLQKIPFSIFDGLLFFRKEEEAFAFVYKIKDLKAKGVLAPTSLEFFDKKSLNFLAKKYSFIPNSEAAVYFEQDAKNEDENDRLLDKWQGLIEESGALMDESIFADSLDLRKKVFEFRHSLPQMINEFLRQNKQIKVATDIAVPDAQFSQMYSFYKTIAEESGINYVNFGHIGESHLHFNFLPQNQGEFSKAKEYLKVFCQKAVSLGGTVSAEHGIGKIKKPYLEIMYERKYIYEMAKLKKYFDPHCLLGLGNIFDKEILKEL